MYCSRHTQSFVPASFLSAKLEVGQRTTSGTCLRVLGTFRVRAGPKTIVFDKECRKRLQAGVDKLADALSVTFGPKGRNVILSEKDKLKVINDGLTIARAIQLPDSIEDVGAALMKEVAAKTNGAAGDGSTTSVLLAREMIASGLLAMTFGANPVSIRTGIDKTVKSLVAILKRLSRPVSGKRDIRAVASISAGHDDFIGNLIADAVEKIGRDGVVTIESSPTSETSVVIESGMKFDKGYMSSQFVTNEEKSVVEFDNAKVLVTDQKISGIGEITPLLEKARQLSLPLLIIAEDISRQVLEMLIINMKHASLAVAVVQCPGFRESKKGWLQDLAVLTGADFICGESGSTVAAMSSDQLGSAHRVVVTRNSTTIIANASTRPEIDARVLQMKRDLEETGSSYLSAKLSQRIAKLSSAIAVIRMGAHTEVELEDRRMRAEDARNATLAAMREGIVPGGGSALVHLSSHVPPIRDSMSCPDERIGADIVAKALMGPLRAIAANAGDDSEAVVQVMRGCEWGFGYNAMTGRFEDLFDAGVLDPCRVVRCALLNAASVTSSFLTAQAVLVEKVKKPEPLVPRVPGITD